jgi:hypothetical protein
MNRCKLVLALGGSLLMGLAGAVRADTSEANLRAELDRVNSRLAEIEGKQNANWLNEQRAEEIKGLVRDVISDADTRASLLAEGATAGHNGQNFFLGSADGANVLKVWGQIQFRYLFNFENLNTSDKEDEGFDIRRAKIGFSGHVTAGRVWDYEVVLALAGGGGAFFQDVRFGTEVAEGLRIDAGLFKLPFTREELTSSKNLTGVERSYFNEFFTGNRAEQIQVTWTSDMFKVRGSISDGMNSFQSPIGTDGAEIALTGRVDVKILGNWDQGDDFIAWTGEGTSLLLGAAVHFETSDGGNGFGPGNYLSWTADASLEVANFGLYGAIAGGHSFDTGGAGGKTDAIGLTIELNYNINDQFVPFARYDMVNDAVLGTSTAHIVTAGINYYFKKHNAKITLDVVWFAAGGVQVGGPENAGGTATGDGFSGTSGPLSGAIFPPAAATPDVHGKDNVVIRLQFQLLF